MNAFCLAVLLALVTVEGESLDAFDYADTPSARREWTAGHLTPAVEIVEDRGRRVMQFAVPFAAQADLERTTLDREVALDLAASGEFALELTVDPPEVVGRLSLYFRSGDGWYAAGAGLRNEGWNTLRFSKAAFNIEGRPAGWHKIDGVRISIWRGQAKDGTCRLRGLDALRHDIALVIPGAAHRDHPELKAALNTAEHVGEMLAELGLGSDAVEDTALQHGALGGRRIAVLAYNPRVEASALDALEEFVDRGGKLLVCYSLPARLASLLGLEKPKYVPQGQPGRFAEIRFDARDVPGLPPSVRQASWNITTAEPTAHHARVIGRWFDREGRATDLPAVLLSDRGAFYSHIILTDDREGKKQMLAALLGRLAPELWHQMVRSQVERVGRVGHLESEEDVLALVRASTSEQPAARRERIRAELDGLSAARTELAQAMEAKDYPRAILAARRAHEALADAYLLAQSSPKVEARAIWNHSGTGAYPGDWERTARELSAAGFNMVLPNMLWGGVAHYASDVLPRSKTFQEHGDQIAQCVAACQKHGLEVHVWKVNWNLARAPRDFVEKMHAQRRTQVSAAGEKHNWLCPSHPENLKLEIDSMLEVARKYDVDGLHFDYIRYPGGDHCYCEGCRRRFEEDRGTKVVRWPGDCHRGPLRDEYRAWRCEQITALVEAVRRESKRLRPDLKISAAVFGSYPACRESVGQDWVAWVKAGYLDFLCPMDYTRSDLELENLVTSQLRLVEGRIPVYPGIGAWRLSPDRAVGQIYHVRRLGAAGFTVFDLSPRSIATHVEAIGRGAGAEDSVPPHRPE